MNRVQERISQIMAYVDELCRANDIKYYIMGGTALGAIRHGGFIPWDDDIDIWMTATEYEKFVKALADAKSQIFVLQEIKIVKKYVQYAKVRMNGTTFIEENLRKRKDLHQGIYIDIMILHKIPQGNRKIRNREYYVQKYLTLKGNLKSGWKPKKSMQYPACLIARCIPKFIDKALYKYVYKYDGLTKEYDYVYYITKANKRQGFFVADIIDGDREIVFEGKLLFAPRDTEQYLTLRYGDYMTLPPEKDRIAAQHAMIADPDRDYREYLNELDKK